MNIKLISTGKISRIIISKHDKNIFCELCGLDSKEIIQQYNEKGCKVIRNNILYDHQIDKKPNCYVDTIQLFSEALTEFSSSENFDYSLNPTWSSGKHSYCHCYINIPPDIPDINSDKFIFAKIYYLLSQCYFGNWPGKSKRTEPNEENDNSKLEIMLVSYTDKISIIITVRPDKIKNAQSEDNKIELLHSNTIYKKDSDDPQYEIVVLGLKELMRIKYQLELKYDEATGIFVSALNETHLDKDAYSAIVYEATNIYWTLKLGYSP